ncbi:hypothetical protein GBAR_LOCUS6815 [Geodia barretti]|uniref:Uncharacterized protein n=1 Tax=Geodia barretti TaxID=519541 RepID=A0AA35WEC9_GEOBA|nr:hypothetical protein GBAR_LOCUS6815 [Geodia barretti]
MSFWFSSLCPLHKKVEGDFPVPVTLLSDLVDRLTEASLFSSSCPPFLHSMPLKGYTLLLRVGNETATATKGMPAKENYCAGKKMAIAK